ncbi:leucine-rich repeat-containing protein 36 isoform X3 [Ascaphus truei]|uniref:leucine-rich repeat-containing protein 36 isoform X3 n=1 Tax=Ascaphus truei TaxID=8439 RepID=UPI003F5A39C5
MGMALRQLHLDELWVCGRAGVPPGSEDTVEALTLQGTYSEKILTLGDAFKNFKSLRSLDLSRNLIISLEGIEYLHALQFLNLYYNNIASLEEIKHLCHLPQLKGLDLRLNPLTRKEADYRLFVIHTLEILETLDDRTVRESERNAAKLHFSLKDYDDQQQREREGKRDNLTKGDSFDERTSAKSHLDLCISSTTELGSKTELNFELGDYLKSSSSASKTMSQETQPQGQSDFEDDSSPPEFSPKDSFAKPTVSESNDRVFSARKLFYDNPDKHGALFLQGPKDSSAYSFTNSYLTSTPLKKERGGSGESKTDAFSVRDEIGQRSEDVKDQLKPFYTEEDKSSNERLLKLSSDLYITTHLNNDPPSSSHSLAALRKGFSDVSKSYVLPSKPLGPKSPLSPTKMGDTPEFPRDYKTAWSPDKGFSLTLETMSTSKSGMKRPSSLNSLLSSKPVYVHKDKNTGDLLSGNGLKEHESHVSSDVVSITNVLQQLMDLVDRYWNGSGSLLLNQRFLLPAQELLSRLMTANHHSVLQTSQVENSLLLSNRNKSAESKTAHGHSEESNNMEALKLKLFKVLEENSLLQSRIHNIEDNTKCKEAVESWPSSQDELWQKYQKLSLQVESLEQQLKQSHKLQDTLHDSQRSLVCTNEYLLQQLNTVSPSHITKAPPAPTEKRNTMEKYFYSEPSETSSLSSAYSSGQYRNPERLSTCPL